jgi:2-keto-4-pentenoate hydratase
MRAVGRLPDPQLTAPVRGLPGIAKTLRLFSAGELAAGALIAAGALLALLPGTGSALEGWHWELASLDLRLSIGGMVLSGSLLSIVAVALGSVFVAGVGAYASRHHLIGA